MSDSTWMGGLAAHKSAPAVTAVTPCRRRLCACCAAVAARPEGRRRSGIGRARRLGPCRGVGMTSRLSSAPPVAGAGICAFSSARTRRAPSTPCVRSAQASTTCRPAAACSARACATCSTTKCPSRGRWTCFAGGWRRPTASRHRELAGWAKEVIAQPKTRSHGPLR